MSRLCEDHVLLWTVTNIDILLPQIYRLTDFWSKQLPQAIDGFEMVAVPPTTVELMLYSTYEGMTA